MANKEFTKNVLTLSLGTTIAQAIPVALSPILTRLYTPSDFGLYALFISIATIFSSISGAKYELAIMLPEDDKDALNLAGLSLLLITLLAMVLLIIAGVFNSQLVLLLENQEIGPWLYFIPFTVFFMGLLNVLTNFNNRIKRYNSISKANVYKAIAMASIQVLIGMLKPGVTGLITGQIASSLTANGRLLKNVLRHSDYKEITRNRMKSLAKKYINFPKYSMFASLAENLSQNLNNILINSIFSGATLGFYFLVQKTLGLPIMIVGASIGRVFYQKASEEYRELGTAISSFTDTFLKLVVSAVVCFLPIYFVVEDVFVFVFGSDWSIAGTYAKLLLPLFAVRYVATSLYNVAVVFDRQRVTLFWQVGFLILTFALLMIAKIYEFSFEDFLFTFTVSISLYYLLLIFILFRISKGIQKGFKS